MRVPRGLDLVVAAAAWCAGFAWIGRGGTWLPLGGMAAAAAARLLARDPEARALLRPSLGALALGLTAGAVQVAVTIGLYGPAARLLPGLRAATRDLYAVLGAGGYGAPALAALIGVIILAEEVVWRGTLLRAVPGGRGRAAAGLLALSTLYALSHAPSGSPLLVLIAFACGAYWGALRLATGSLFASAVAHVLWDAAILLAWPLEQ